MAIAKKYLLRAARPSRVAVVAQRPYEPYAFSRAALNLAVLHELPVCLSDTLVPRFEVDNAVMGADETTHVFVHFPDEQLDLRGTLCLGTYGAVDDWVNEAPEKHTKCTGHLALIDVQPVSPREHEAYQLDTTFPAAGEAAYLLRDSDSHRAAQLRPYHVSADGVTIGTPRAESALEAARLACAWMRCLFGDDARNPFEAALKDAKDFTVVVRDNGPSGKVVYRAEYPTFGDWCNWGM